MHFVSHGSFTPPPHQVRSLLGQIRPDRQTVLFSATFRPALERLARDFLSEPVRFF